MDKREIIGNLTTIIKICIMTVAPAIAIYLSVPSETVITFLTAVLTFILAVYDAKYPNTLLTPITAEPTEPTILNDEYIIPDIEDGDEDGE